MPLRPPLCEPPCTTRVPMRSPRDLGPARPLPGLSHDPTCPLFQALSGLRFSSRSGEVHWACPHRQVEHFKPCSQLADPGLMCSRPGPSTKAVPCLPSRQCGAHLLGPAPPQVPQLGEQSRACLSILQMREPRPRKGMPYLRVWLQPQPVIVFVYFLKIILFLVISGLSCGTWAV